MPKKLKQRRSDAYGNALQALMLPSVDYGTFDVAQSDIAFLYVTDRLGRAKVSKSSLYARISR